MLTIGSRICFSVSETFPFGQEVLPQPDSRPLYPGNQISIIFYRKLFYCATLNIMFGLVHVLYIVINKESKLVVRRWKHSTNLISIAIEVDF